MTRQPQVIATVPYMGKRFDVFVNPSQWATIKFTGSNFTVNKLLGNQFERLNREYENFCEKELGKIVKKGISRLRTKKIDLELMYTDGVKIFPKKVRKSVDDHLKDLGYKKNLDFKVGKYDKEWGINEINPKNKKFILYFNLNLIKYDSGPHIEYVVAHELTHVFHRDHGPGFQQALLKLFPRKNSSEAFFEKGISNVFRLPAQTPSWIFYVLICIFILAILWWLISFIFDELFFGNNRVSF